VAKAAGVSPTTVTHALNPPPGARVKPETRRRIQRIAREMGYRPSFVGRALVSGKTYTVGLLQPDHETLFYPLYQQVLLGMVRAMDADDYNILTLFRSADDRYLRVVRQGRVDGMFILQSDRETRCTEKVIATGIPTVVVNKDYPVAADRAVGCVRSDHEGLMEELVEEFVSLSCRTILMVLDHRFIDANALIHDAFVIATGRRADRGLVGSTMIPSEENFRLQIRSALASGQRWDGIVTDGVAYAEAILAEAEAAGLRAGRDFQLITTDIHDRATTRSRRERSAYTQQPRTVGQEAWAVLRGLIQNERTERRVLVPYRRTGVTDAEGPSHHNRSRP